MALVSAAPILALLDEPDYQLKAYALESLDSHVDQLWAEVADHITQIEELYEDEAFPAPQLAALVASKVYYNLGEFNASMKYALVAGDRFDLSAQSEYIETIVSKCISHYIKISQRYHDAADRAAFSEEGKTIDPKLVSIVERMIRRCVDAGDYRLALGVALEARRLDIISNLIQEYLQKHGHDEENDPMSLINYVLECSITLVTNREFRTRVLNLLVDIITSLPSPDYFAISKIIVQLNDSDLAIRLFRELVGSGAENDRLVAFQVAFDLVASASQKLLDNVGADFAQEESSAHTKLVKILSGVPTCDLNITFLQKHNNTDLSILTKNRNQLEGRNSIFHSAVTFQNAFLHAGTTADAFFRENLEWLSKATNWTKFSATAALGVIHQGNLSQGRRILQPYLPGSQGSCYSQGGSLYALGIIFAGHGREIIDYLRQHVVEGGNSVQGTEAEVVLHGAALGTGVAGMGSGNLDIYGELRNVLFSDSAIAGEAAGLAMGLVMLGSKNEETQAEMLQYAHDTQHEKIIRSLAMGIALLNYAKEEAADDIIDTLVEEQNPILRYGGAFTIALAYAGTGNNRAIKRLLHIAVSDASDDVRRAAVMGLGFILLRNHTAAPRMVQLLSESHNPHVRYGTALALGISCAGTGLKEAIDVLMPMMKDPVDFVRQGSMIAIAMILIQQNEKTFPRVNQFHQAFAKVISSKHEDAMAKFGAALAQGIIDAAGRNVTISLENIQTGSLNTKAVVGIAVFVQFWYWFPITHFLSLAFTPTTIIGLREDLKIPQFEFNCNANPKLFGYPPKVETSSEKTEGKLVTAILSTTARAKHRAKKASEAKKKSKLQEMGIENDESETEKTSVKPEDGEKMDTEEALPKEQSEDEIETGSHKSYKVENASRVLPSQFKYISFDQENRFVPIRKFRGIGGVVIVKDNSPKEPVKFIKTVRQVHSPDEEEDDAPLPEPFIYDEDEE